MTSEIHEAQSEEFPLVDSTAVENKETEDNEVIALLSSAETNCRVCCRPRCLQIFAKPIFVLVILTTYCFIEAIIVSGLTPVVISSLETRYDFSSTQLGVLTSTFDCTVLVTVIFISYFAADSHKPRWLGVGACFLGIGTLLFASPHFLTGTYDVGRSANLSNEACRDVNNFSPDCDEKSGKIYFLFVFANILIGIGGAPLFTVGTSFIDDIIHPKYVSICLGIYYTAAVIGASLGFGIGGVLLKIYVDPWKETTLEESDPGWVGAWWISFVMFGILALLISIPFFFFPKQFSDTNFVQQERLKQMSKDSSKKLNKQDLNVKFHIKELPRQLLDLLVNVPFVLATTSYALILLTATGFLSFFPKYLEAQFGLIASSGSLASGAVGIISTAVGIMLGALLVHFKKPTTKKLTLYYAIINLISVVFLGGFFLRCLTHDIAGVTVSYPNSTLFDDQTLNATCNSHCDCKSAVFEPVCSDGITYFSPCRAGCDKYYLNDDRDKPRFDNCTCSSGDSAENGYCDEHCVMLLPFLIMVGLLLTATAAIQIPVTVIVIRCISDEQRTLALGVQSVFIRALGYIPSPIIVGALFDASCLYWQEECGDRGNCWVYDNDDLTVSLFSMGTSIRILSILCAFGAWIFFDATLCNWSNNSGRSAR